MQIVAVAVSGEVWHGVGVGSDALYILAGSAPVLFQGDLLVFVFLVQERAEHQRVFVKARAQSLRV